MPGLPPGALEVLDTVAAGFSETGKPFKAATVKKLTPPNVRAAMSKAAREAASDQAPAVLYDPGHAGALVVMRVEDLAAVMARPAPSPTTGVEGHYAVR